MSSANADKKKNGSSQMGNLLFKVFWGWTTLAGPRCSATLMPAGISPRISGNLLVCLHHFLGINSLVGSPPRFVHRWQLTEPFALCGAWDAPFHGSPISKSPVITDVRLGHGLQDLYVARYSFSSCSGQGWEQQYITSVNLARIPSVRAVLILTLSSCALLYLEPAAFLSLFCYFLGGQPFHLNAG